MRRSLAWISAAVTSLVAVSFLVPLLVLVGDLVRDRALAEAFRDASATAALVALDPSPTRVSEVVTDPPTGSTGSTSVHLPAASGAGPPAATTVGPAAASESAVNAVMNTGRAATAPVEDGVAVLQPVLGAAGLVAVVEVDVPRTVLNAGVLRARVTLAAFAVLMVVGSVALADRLAARVVRAAQRLAAASGRLGSGDLAVRVLPEGPTELRHAARAFNTMADRVGRLLLAERELVADLSHRLRTPLAGLVLAGRSLGPGLEGDQVRALTVRLEEEVDAVIREARTKRDATQPAECDAVAVLRDRLDFWGALADDQDRPWSLRLPDAPEIRVPVRAGDLHAVVDAVLNNVFLHTPEGCGFAVELSADVDRACVVVGDAGPGIGEPDRAVRRGASGVGSTGLGLDIVVRVAEDCGGRLTIGRSRLGGAQIAVDLPVGAARTAHDDAHLTGPGGGEPGPARSARTRADSWRARGRRAAGTRTGR